VLHAAAGEAEFGAFLHRRRGAERACARRAVSPAPISLRIQPRSAPNLTLVGLAGLTKVAVEGGSTRWCAFIAPPRALILAVTPANHDLAESDALRIAREVDPTGCARSA
jgi:dynamin 1-like protein